MVDYNILKDNINNITSMKYWIIYIIIFVMIYNFRYFNNKINFGLILIITTYFLYNHLDQFKYRFNNSQLTTQGNLFFKKLIGDKRINPELTTILYNGRTLYPYDHKNYVDTLNLANEITLYLEKFNNCSFPLEIEQLIQNFKSCANNLLNSFNSIGYSLPPNNSKHVKLSKDLEKLLYTYISNYSKEHPVDSHNEDIPQAERTFLFYRL